MCGIIGYIGNKQAQPVLLNGLKHLEYRGYDSAGMCVLSDAKKALSLRKLPGKVKDLENLLSKKPLSGSLGVGHCLASDTLVLLADGRFLPISKIEDGEEVFSFNIRTQRLEPARVKITCHNSPKYIYHLRTSFSSLKCTAFHKMFIMAEGKIVEKRAADIKKGDLLIIPKNIEIQERKIQFKPIFVKRYFKATREANRLIKTRMWELELTWAACASSSGITEAYLKHVLQNDRNFREDELAKLLPSLSIELHPDYFIPQHTIHGKFIRLPDQSSPELMQIIGYLLGDGTVKERCIRFKDLDRDILYVYQGLIEKVFNIKGRVVPLNGTKAWLLEVNSYYLCQWLKENVISREEEFLSELGKLPQNEMAAFLRGIFDAEGSVNLKSGQISLRITNQHLVRISQFLLLRCGMITSFHTEKKNVKNWNDAYGISLNRLSSFKQFISTIDFSSKRKTGQLKTLILKRKGYLRYWELPDLNIVAQPILEIKKIKSGEDILFDLEVDHPDSNFIANGLLSHNSRWATHGAPNQVNAHPHFGCDSDIAVVHNGIIENYAQLKAELIREGHKFRSQTDTEVIVHLIEKFYKNSSLEEAVRKAATKLTGSFALGVISSHEPDKILGARRGSPLVVGVGEGENFLASDIPALLDYTKKVIFLQEDEMVILTKDSVKISDLSGQPISREISTITWDVKQAQKQGFSHFMLKEINEQPQVLETILNHRIVDSKIQFEELKIDAKALAAVKDIIIVACGTAYHAGLVGKYILEELTRIPVCVDVSSEFRYRSPIIDRNSLVITISQSGETADTLAALRLAKSKGALTLGICNVVGSTLTRECDGIIYTFAGPEVSVASTKAYIAQLVVLYLLAIYLGQVQKVVSEEAKAKLLVALSNIRRGMKEILAKQKSIQKIANNHAHFGSFLFLGRNVNYPTALEGALKLKEISYIPAEGYAAGEMKHGPIALIDEYRAVVCITPDSKVYEKMVSNIQEIRSRRGKIIAIASHEDDKIKELTDEVIYIPRVDEFFSPLITVLPLQLLAYYIARKRGCDVDQPRNLAKSVTVE